MSVLKGQINFGTIQFKNDEVTACIGAVQLNVLSYTGSNQKRCSLPAVQLGYVNNGYSSVLIGAKG